MQFTDEWLVPTLEPMLPADGLAAIRQEVAAPGSLWETAVQRKLITALAKLVRLLSGAGGGFQGDVPKKLNQC